MQYAFKNIQNMNINIKKEIYIYYKGPIQIVYTVRRVYKGTQEKLN